MAFIGNQLLIYHFKHERKTTLKIKNLIEVLTICKLHTWIGAVLQLCIHSKNLFCLINPSTFVKNPTKSMIYLWKWKITSKILFFAVWPNIYIPLGLGFPIALTNTYSVFCTSWILFPPEKVKKDKKPNQKKLPYLNTKTRWIGSHHNAKMTITINIILMTRFLLRILSADAWPPGPCFHKRLNITLYIPMINKRGKTYPPMKKRICKYL